MTKQGKPGKTKISISGYQKFVVILLTFFQFTIMLNFMVISPLGAILLPALQITPRQFGLVVSCYALSATVSGILIAGFADRFERKKLLLFVYGGFLAGTLLCAFSVNYSLFVVARCITGLFGGVIGAINISIITDILPIQSRGSAMGILSSANPAAMVLGIPIGIFLANKLNWHAPFYLITIIGLVAGIVMILFMKPVTEHNKIIKRNNPIAQLLNTVANPNYMIGFSALTFITIGAFILQPFSTVFIVNNLGVSLNLIPLVFLVSGIVGMVAAPLSGHFADVVGKYRLFFIANIVSASVIICYTNLRNSPFWFVLLLNCIIAISISGRMTATMALISTVPAPEDRGSFNSVTVSIQQLAGAIAAWVAGLVIVQSPTGVIRNMNILGWIVVVALIFSVVMMARVNNQIKTADTSKLMAAHMEHEGQETEK
jgi:predicted MFS family arabinose efflux permease